MAVSGITMQTQTDSPPIPTTLTEIIQALKPGESHLFEEHSLISIRAIASRLNSRRSNAPKLVTRKMGERSIRVWRREPKASRKT